MCLYPKLILNKKYTSTKKNKGVIPPCPDERLRYVTAACGECYECRKQKQRAWVTRMTEEILQMWAEIGIKQEGNEISRGQMENYAQKYRDWETDRKSVV